MWPEIGTYWYGGNMEARYPDGTCVIIYPQKNDEWTTPTFSAFHEIVGNLSSFSTYVSTSSVTWKWYDFKWTNDSSTILISNSIHKGSYRRVIKYDSYNMSHIMYDCIIAVIDI